MKDIIENIKNFQMLFDKEKDEIYKEPWFDIFLLNDQYTYEDFISYVEDNDVKLSKEFSLKLYYSINDGYYKSKLKELFFDV